jgi:ubiquinol-cytochrome c reductase cytochrome b subunit
VPKKMNKLGATGRSIRGFFVPVESPAPVSPAVGEPKELTGASAIDHGREGGL